MKNYNCLVKRLNISSAIILTTDIKPTVVDTSLRCNCFFYPRIRRTKNVVVNSFFVSAFLNCNMIFLSVLVLKIVW